MINLLAGLLFLFLLAVITFFVLLRLGFKEKELYAIFIIAFFIHLCAVLLIYYTSFKPFGGGADYALYDRVATEIAHRFSRLNFSLDGLYTEHFFPLLIGIVYMLTLPDMLVGQLFTVWLSAVSVLLFCLMVLEIGGTKKTAFWVGLIANIYPSYLYFGSVLLKDTIIIPLVLAGMLLFIKMMKNFTALKFLAFFIILTGLINLRFYIGYALMFSFVICWFLLSSLEIKERIVYGAAIVFLLGFPPQFSGGGYYGLKNFENFIKPAQITFYREVAYGDSLSGPSQTSPSQTSPSQTSPSQTLSQQVPVQEKRIGNSSTFALETGFGQGPLKFFESYSKSFLYSLLGPFPWQFRYKRQIVGLAETIPWYLLIIISFYGFINFIRRKGILEFLRFYRFSLPLLMFGVLALGALSLFINNYGIIARIRIPIFICFLSVMFISFNNDIENYSKVLYEKIFSHRGSWLHWFSSFRGTFKTGA